MAVDPVKSGVNPEDLVKELERLAIGEPAAGVTPKPAGPQSVWTIKNAHQDDIHGMRQFSGGFVTGSKDGSLRLWNREGQLTNRLFEPDGIDYTQWITAIGSNDTVLVSGTRNSWLDAWGPDGKCLNKKSFRFSPHVDGDHKSKQRNQNRINCIEVLPEMPSGDSPFFLGGPAHLHLLTLSKKGWFKHHSSTKVHHNDWAYCVQPVSRENPCGDLLVVVGAQIDLLRRNLEKSPFIESAWDHSEPIVRENMRERGERTIHGRRQVLRALIPKIKTHPVHPQHLTYVCFENNRGFGPVRIVDLETKKIIFDGQEHRGRSWDIAYPQPHLLATGADDRTIKLWDTRMRPRAFYTFPVQSGRVSCLLSPKENCLLATSCPDNVKDIAEKARITFWDLRLPKTY